MKCSKSIDRMEYLQSLEWNDFLENSLQRLLSMNPIPYSQITPSVIPVEKGIYLISEATGLVEICLYVGRTKNLQERIYRNHLMGDLANARLKKYICNDTSHEAFGDMNKAKAYIKANCQVRWIFEPDVRKRGALESYFTARLFPKYGISEEH